MTTAIIRHVTTAERDALQNWQRPVGTRVYNMTTAQDERWNGTAWQVVTPGGGGSLVPQPWQNAPTLTSLRDAMVLAGVMTPQPTYAVSGVVSGSVLAGVALSLVGAQTYNTVSDGSGAFAFPAVVDGSYTLTATISGHWFTPASRSVTVAGAAVTAQNFVAALSVPSARVGNTKLIIPKNGAVAQLLDINTRALTTPTLFAGKTNFYPAAFANNRWFVPRPTSNVVEVYNEDCTALLTTITGISGAMQVHFESGKLAVFVSGGGAVRFVNYNFATNTWTLGTQVTIPTGGFDSAAGAGKIWVANTTNNSVGELDVASETFVTRTLPTAMGGGILNIEFGGGVLFLSGSGSRVVNSTTLATIANSAVTATSHRTSFANNHFLITNVATNDFVRIDATTGVATVVAAAIAVSGSVSNASHVFAGVQGAGNVRVYNASTFVQDGATLTSAAAWFPRN